MRVVVGLLVLVLVASGGWIAARHLAPAETKIERRLAAMAEGFNDTRLSPCMAGLAQDYHDTSGADREWIRQGLVASFFRERDPGTKRFRWRVELPREALRIAVDPEAGDRAKASLVARFHEREGTEEHLAWEVRIDAHLEERDGDWVITRTSHETVSGSKWWR